jgi:hypothetical protein
MAKRLLDLESSHENVFQGLLFLSELVEPLSVILRRPVLDLERLRRIVSDEEIYSVETFLGRVSGEIGVLHVLKED